MQLDTDKKHSLISALSTFLIMAIVVLVCAFMGLNPPDPPIPEEGVEVNLGDSDLGLGDAENPDNSANMQPASAPVPSAGEQVSTQNTEQTVRLNTSKTPTTTTRRTETKPTETKPAEQPQPQTNPNAIFPGKKNNANGGSQGVTSGTGNQGKAGGDPNSDRYDGTPGNGGAGWSLNGRKSSFIPKPPTNNTNTEGSIIVKIWVDREGKVVKAEAPQKGSTLTRSDMVAKAKAAALQAKFNADPNATELQVGTITYVYRSNN